jgi:hypothetical protein
MIVSGGRVYASRIWELEGRKLKLFEWSTHFHKFRMRIKSLQAIPNTVLSIYTISQQMHCSDSLLISYSSYMFRRMYVIIKEPSIVCPAELH